MRKLSKFQKFVARDLLKGVATVSGKKIYASSYSELNTIPEATMIALRNHGIVINQEPTRDCNVSFWKLSSAGREIALQWDREYYAKLEAANAAYEESPNV